MANVTLVSSTPPAPFDRWKHSVYFLLKHSAEIDSFGVHQLVDDPNDADIILFAEMGTAGSFAEMVRAHPYHRRFRNKCFLFENGDISYPILPGLYTSLTRDLYRPDHTRTGFYLQITENVFINYSQPSGDEKYLASFVGSINTHPIRQALLELKHPDIYIGDTSKTSTNMRYHATSADRAKFWEDYANFIADARFSLCPRGRGPNSIRLYESMKTGRACVILSDEWQPNDDVDWDSFSIRVPESQATRLPEILEEHAHRSAEMGRNARLQWERWFSEPVRFHNVVEKCLEIDRVRKGYHPIRSLYHYKYIPEHFRHYLSSKANLYRNNKKIYW